MDKFLNYMKLNDEEDEGFYDDDYLDDEEEVEPVKKFSPAKSRQQAQEDDEAYFTAQGYSDPSYCYQENARNRHGSLCDQTYFRRGCTGDYRDTSGEPDSGTESGRPGCGYRTEDH